jgi:hypothetical protein
VKAPCLGIEIPVARLSRAPDSAVATITQTNVRFGRYTRTRAPQQLVMTLHFEL